VPKKTREPIAAGGPDDPAAKFRQLTAECLELAQETSSLEKRRVYLDLARACFRLALRWEAFGQLAHRNKIFVLKSQVFNDRT